MLRMFRQLHTVAAANRLQIRLRANKSHQGSGGHGASPDGALTLNSALLPRCQRSTGTPEGSGILDRPCTELLQTFMNRTIYASTFPSFFPWMETPPPTPQPPKNANRLPTVARCLSLFLNRWGTEIALFRLRLSGTRVSITHVIQSPRHLR